MSDYTNEIMAIRAEAHATHGVELIPFQSDEELVNFWIAGWRLASPGEQKAKWVRNFSDVADSAAWSCSLSGEEGFLVLDELARSRASSSAQDSSPSEDVASSTPEWLNSLSPSSTSSRSKPERRGRKRGSVDKEPRAPRGSQMHLTRAEKSRLCRAKEKRRKEQEQQQQQQQQSFPPEG